ncbi:MAG TPA: hypothetical protein VKH63_23615 [Candidatus Acidoferrum sp.]|nr:hypothetical protein [Candidatus Acidoferrum sp.]
MSSGAQRLETRVIVIPSEAKDLLFPGRFQQPAEPIRFPFGFNSNPLLRGFHHKREFKHWYRRALPVSIFRRPLLPHVAQPGHSFFCAFHARQQLQLLESQRLGDEISASLNGDFLTATDINHVLGKLFAAVAQDRIPLRKATALAFLGQVLLSSLPHVKKEFPFSYKFNHWNKVLANAAPLSAPPSLTDSNSSPEDLQELPEPDSPEED